MAANSSHYSVVQIVKQMCNHQQPLFVTFLIEKSHKHVLEYLIGAALFMSQRSPQVGKGFKFSPGQSSQTGSQRKELGVEHLPKTLFKKSISGKHDLIERCKTCTLCSWFIFVYV